MRTLLKGYLPSIASFKNAVSVITIIDGVSITINEGGEWECGIGIPRLGRRKRVSRGRSQSGAPGKERQAEVALISERLQLRNRSGSIHLN